MAVERVTLYGVPLVAGRKVPYGRIDPEVSRDLFIRHALVAGRVAHPPRVLRTPTARCSRTSRSSSTGPGAATSWSTTRRCSRSTTSGCPPTWSRPGTSTRGGRRRAASSRTCSPSTRRCWCATTPTRSAPPTTRTAGAQGDLTLPLSYQFEPGADADGVTVHVPLTVLNRLSADGFDWQVPGLRADLVTALLRSLPKALRRSFVPAPDSAAAALRQIGPEVGDEPFADALARELRHATGVTVPREAWDLAKVPDHLRMTFRVEDDGGRGRRGQGPRGAARPAGPDGAAHGRRGGRRGRAGRADVLVVRRPAGHVRPGGRRPHRGRASPRWSTRARSVALRVLGSAARGAVGDLGRRPAAARPHGALAAEGRGGPAGQREQAGLRATTRTARCPPCSTTG